MALQRRSSDSEWKNPHSISLKIKISTHMNYEVDPDLDRDLQKFGKWLEAETERQNQDVNRSIVWSLCGYALLMILVTGAALYFPVSERIAFSMVIATCSFCIICALAQLTRCMLLSNFHTSMNIRWLATFLHDIRKERRMP